MQNSRSGETFISTGGDVRPDARLHAEARFFVHGVRRCILVLQTSGIIGPGTEEDTSFPRRDGSGIYPAARKGLVKARRSYSRASIRGTHYWIQTVSVCVEHET